MDYNPEASELTRRRIRIEEKGRRAAERGVERVERFNRWLDSRNGQRFLVVTLAVVLLATARLAGILGN